MLKDKRKRKLLAKKQWAHIEKQFALQDAVKVLSLPTPKRCSSTPTARARAQGVGAMTCTAIYRNNRING